MQIVDHGNAVIIANDRIEIAIRPERGGSLEHVRYNGRDLFRCLTARGATDWNPLDMACFPLVPFSNRIEHGRFTFDGHQATLSPNMGDHPHAIHGQGWLGKWRQTLKTDTACEMQFVYEADEWPWSYTGRQHLSVYGDAFRHELSVQNKSPKTMPAGLGLHPQFTKTPACSIRAGVEFVWLTTSDGIPTEKVSVPQDWALADGKNVSDLHVDHCFAEWNRVARIEWPELHSAVTISADEILHHLVVFVPQGQNFFCVEPVSHMPNALNQSDPLGAGMVALQPEQELTAGVTYLFEDL